MKYGHLFAVVFLCMQGLVSSDGPQLRLMEDLFDNDRYKKAVGPFEGTKPLLTTIALSVRQVVELVEPLQILHVNAWIHLKWNDCRLVWNPANYSGLMDIVLPHHLLWVPDVQLVDYAEIETPDITKYELLVEHNGDVTYNYPYFLSVVCQLDVTYFPFDVQDCPIRFASPTHDAKMINLTNLDNVTDLTDLVPNNEFNVFSLRTHRVLRGRLSGGRWRDFYQVVFKLRLDRKAVFYVMNMLVPYLVMTVLSVLGFLIPPDAGEKIVLEITVLLSLAVFLLVVTEILPSSSETLPLMSVYFFCAIFLVSLSTVLSTFVLNVHHTQHKPVPKWMLSFLQRMTRVRFFKDIIGLTRGDSMAMATQKNIIDRFKAVQSFQQRRRWSDSGVDPSEFFMRGKNFNTSAGNSIINADDIRLSDAEQERRKHDLSRLHVPDYKEPLEDLASTLEKKRRLLQKMDTIKGIKFDMQHQRNEWRELAMIFDRLFLVLIIFLYLAICIVVIISIAASKSFAGPKEDD